MKPEVLAILCIFLTFIVLEMIFTHFFRKPRQTRDDGVVEVVGTMTLILVTQPFVLAAGGFVASLAAPNAAGSLAALPFIAQFGLLLIFDDMMQYWWHRLTHNVKWLYNLHRAHHNAEYLSIRIVLGFCARRLPITQKLRQAAHKVARSEPVLPVLDQPTNGTPLRRH